MRQHSVFPGILSKEWGEGCFDALAFRVSSHISKEWGEGCFNASEFRVSRVALLSKEWGEGCLNASEFCVFRHIE